MDRIALKGAPGSPYTRKMLALLRYRRIPYRFLIGMHGGAAGLPSPKVDLLPTFFLSGASGDLEAVVDSTPIIRRLEREHAGRAAVPPSPVLRFLDELLEDYADEWLTKAMFHYRWHYADDIDRAGTILPIWRDVTAPEDQLRAAKAMFSRRQIDRLYVVGSTPETAGVIEASYERFLALLDAHLSVHPFLMGGRPGASDFAAFGQLTQLTHFDPTPMAQTLAQAPRVFAWVDVIEDLSGIEPADTDWLDVGALPPTIAALLREVARTYVPVMLANARAVGSGAELVEASVEGAAWRQKTFPYQAKCVEWLRQSYLALPAEGRAAVTAILDETGCLPLVAAPLD
jgi:glutathione S-transferase